MMETIARISWLFGAVGAACVLGAAAHWFIYGSVGTLGTVLALSGAVLLVAYAAFDRERIQEEAGSRAFLYGGGAILVTTVAGVIAVGGYLAVERLEVRWDLTREGRFTLSSHTESVLAGVEENVEIFGVFPHGTRQARLVRSLASAYESQSTKIRYEAVDPTLQHKRTLEVTRTETDLEFESVASSGVIVLTTADGRRERIESDFTNEERLTNALVRLLEDEDHRICWSRGHGERDPDDGETIDGMGSVNLKMEDANYQVEFLEIRTRGIPDGCHAVVIAAPQIDFSQRELDSVAGYLGRGGRVMLLLDSLADGQPLPNLTADLERYGLAVGFDLVHEQSQSNVAGGPFDERLSVYFPGTDAIPAHPMTAGLVGPIEVDLARSVSRLPSTPGLDVSELVRSSGEASWAEDDVDDEGRVVVGFEADERIGPLSMAAAVVIVDPQVIDPIPDRLERPSSSEQEEAVASDTEPAGSAEPVEPVEPAAVPSAFALEPGGRLVVVGDSHFVSNRLASQGANDDFFLNGIAWLLEEESQLGERPRGTIETLVLPASTFNALGLASMVGVPGGALLIGLVIWLRRRRL